MTFSKLPHLCSMEKALSIAFLFPFHSLGHYSITMTGKMSCPSLVFLRSMRHMPLSRQCSRPLPVGGRRNLHTSPKSFSNEVEKTFRGQLYESTARRIQAQREAEARFASMSPTSDFARQSAFTFGTHVSAAGLFTADSCSHRLLMRPSLLVWNHET